MVRAAERWCAAPPTSASPLAASLPPLQVNGQVIIESFEGFSMLNMMFMQSIPQRIMRLCFQMQRSCMPFRLRWVRDLLLLVVTCRRCRGA
jgi:hypothetical protein